MKLTSKEYLKYQGLVCPNCLSKTVRNTGNPDDTYPDKLFWEATCNNCGAEWVDEYTLTAYSTID